MRQLALKYEPFIHSLIRQTFSFIFKLIGFILLELWIKTNKTVLNGEDL